MAELDPISVSAGKTFGPAEVDFLKAERSTKNTQQQNAC